MMFYDNRPLIKTIYEGIAQTESCANVDDDMIEFLTDNRSSLIGEYLDSLIIHNFDNHNSKSISILSHDIPHDEIAHII
jgi:hypothetical protein